MQQLIKKLAHFNPWWDGQTLPAEKSYEHKRPVFDLVKKISLNRDLRRSVVLLGPRRAGKTVLLKQLISTAIEEGQVLPSNVCFAEMDHYLMKGANPYTIVTAFKEKAMPDQVCLVLLDEIQECEDWQKHLKSLTDNERQCQFVVSGSVAAALARRSKEAGTGRFMPFRLPPVLFYEYLEYENKWPVSLPKDPSGARQAELNEAEVNELNNAFIDYLEYGACIEPIFNPKIRRNRATLISSELPNADLFYRTANMYGISVDEKIDRLFYHCCNNNGKVLSITSISNQTGIKYDELARYYEYFKAAFLVRRIKKLGPELRGLQRDFKDKYILENPSMYAMVKEPITLDSKDAGHAIEGATIAQFQATSTFSRLLRQAKICHYGFKRNRKEYEIDMVHATKGTNKIIRLSEIKWSDNKSQLTHGKENLEYVMRRHKLSGGEFEGSYCTTKSTYPKTTGNVRFLPTAQYCVSLGLESFDYEYSRQTKKPSPKKGQPQLFS